MCRRYQPFLVTIRNLFSIIVFSLCPLSFCAQDAATGALRGVVLVAGAPATVQNSYSTKRERGPSVTDQRQRLTLSAIEEPNPFAEEQKALAAKFNHWKISGIVWQRTPDQCEGVGRCESGREHEQ